MPEVGILIPAYEAGRTVAGVVSACREIAGASSIIVIDDGSTDDTLAKARDAGPTCIRHPQNRGKGAALCTGFTEASRLGWDAAITIDADGQHDPVAIPTFIEEYNRCGPGIIIGTRRRTGKMPLVRRASNRLSSSVVSWLAGQRVRDSQSGYRLITREVWETVPLSTNRYDMETEMLVRAARRGFAICAVPIPTVYADETSHFHPFRDTARVVRVLWRLWREAQGR